MIISFINCYTQEIKDLFPSYSYKDDVDLQLFMTSTELIRFVSYCCRFMGNVEIILQGTQNDEPWPQSSGTTVGQKAIGMCEMK